MKSPFLFSWVFIGLFLTIMPISALSQDLGVKPIAPIVPSLPQDLQQNKTPEEQAGGAGNRVAVPSSPANSPSASSGGPVCGWIENKSGYKIYGSLATDIAGEREGVPARHRATIRLEDGEKMDVCSEGPFFEGQRLELTLRSLFPLFSCKSRIAGHTIIIQSEPREEGGLRFFANCI